MAELALSAFAALSAGTTVTSAALGSGALSTLSTVATVGSMLSTLVASFGAYRQSESEAAIAGFNADAAQLEAREKALRIRREYVQKVGQARVAFAGSGLDISSSANVEQGYRNEMQFETSLASSGGDIAAASGGMAAAAARSRGRMSLAAAAGRAIGSYADNRISIARRG